MSVRFIRRHRKYAHRHAPHQPAAGKGGGATSESTNSRLLVVPENWFRASFPGVFIDDEERVFADRDGELTGFSSEFLVARCLGRAGNSDNPVVYCPEEEEFYAYSPTTGLYEHQTVDEVRKRVVDLLERCAGDCRPEYRAEILALRTRRVVAAVADALRAESPMGVSELEPDFGSVAVENGMLDLRTLRLDPFGPERPVRSKLPIAWNPLAPDPAEFMSIGHPVSLDTRLG